MFTHATPPEHGMAIIQQWPKGPEVTFTYERMTCPSVWIGKCLEDALVPSTTSNTFAWDVVLSLTELTVVFAHRNIQKLLIASILVSISVYY